METSEKLMIRAYLSGLLNSQLTYFLSQLEGLSGRDNDESIHQTRVMSRRLRNTLTVFSPYLEKKQVKKWVSSLKSFAGSLTRIRDLDVQIQTLEEEIRKISDQKYQAGLIRLQLRKKQRRDKKHVDIHQAILDFEASKTISEIKIFIEKNPYDQDSFTAPEKLKQIANQNLDVLMVKCFGYVPYISDSSQTEALHNLRISIKNLRYMVELFTPMYPQLNEKLIILKQFQDELGAIHDCDVWINDLDNFLNKEKKRIINFYGQAGPFNFILPGITYLADQIIHRKLDQHTKFMEHWNKEYQNQFWTGLKAVFTPTPV